MAPILRTMARKLFLSLFLSVLICSVPVLAAGGRTPEPEVALTAAVASLDRDASIDTETPMIVAYQVQKEYGTREEELKWALGRKLSWGEITALAYIQATTGKTFAEMDQENAQRDFWSYAENAGMDCAKMAHSLDVFVKRVDRERNSRIFNRLRASRSVHALPDLGSGFGLFQESLDFRRIDSPSVTKIHDIPGELAKGGK